MVTKYVEENETSLVKSGNSSEVVFKAKRSKNTLLRSKTYLFIIIVVCAFGRNNVPECQPDGTWSDIPRCIEHDPGFEEQKTKLCPGIPGYCSDSPIGQLCEFDCLIGPDIRFVPTLVIGCIC